VTIKSTMTLQTFSIHMIFLYKIAMHLRKGID